MGQRIEAVAKMGYYPTPLSQVDLIRKYLSFEEGANILDPCAGCGLALQRLAPAGVETYGIELDGRRAEEAAERLHHVKHVAIEKARISMRAFSALYLNPPYDNVSTNGDAPAAGVRKEELFVVNTTKYLVHGGILIFVIPLKQLTPSLSQVLVNRYSNIQVFKFTEDEFGSFGQVVLFGIRRKGGSYIAKSEMVKVGELIEMGQGLRDVPVLGEEAIDTIYKIPAAPGPVQLFRAATEDPEELMFDLNRSANFESVEKLLGLDVGDLRVKSPLLPFKRTHMATLIASGALNSALGRGDRRHLVVGMSKKIPKVVSSEVNEGADGETQKVVTEEVLQTVVRVFMPTGEIRTLE